VQEAALIGALDRIEADLPALAAAEGVRIGKVFGVTDLLREVHRALDPEAPAPLPQGAMVAREFLLFQNSASNDLPDFVDSRYSRTRMTIRLPWMEAGTYARLIERIEREFAQSLARALRPNPNPGPGPGPGPNLGPDQIKTDLPKVVLTGNMALLAQTSVNVIGAMAQGYLISLVAIAGLMVLTMGGLRLGLAAMLPNLVPVVVALGVMGYAGIPLDSFTMLIGTVALGIIVDDTIHLFHQLRRAEAEGRTGLDALDFAVGHSFVPIIATSLAVMAGFSAYAFSSMSNVVAFGLLTALISAFGLAADMVLSPAIYAVLGPRRDAPPVDNCPADNSPAAAPPAPV
jgi:predicted RND superfamily exporter protein